MHAVDLRVRHHPDVFGGSPVHPSRIGERAPPGTRRHRTYATHSCTLKRSLTVRVRPATREAHEHERRRHLVREGARPHPHTCADLGRVAAVV